MKEIIIHPTTKWTLYNKHINVKIHANSIFDIAVSKIYHGLESIVFPSIMNSEGEYLSMMRNQGFTVVRNLHKKTKGGY